MDIKIVISGKKYDMDYEKSGTTYTVNLNHPDFNSIMPSPFTFHIKDGKVVFLIIGQKANEVAREIINQIAIFEGRL